MTLSKHIISLVLISVFFVGAANAMDYCMYKGACVGIPVECGKFCCNKVFLLIRKYPGSASICAGMVAAGIVVYYALRSHKTVAQKYDEFVGSDSQNAVLVQQENQQIFVH